MYDPYSVLGLSSDATEDEIKKAYRALSRKYHPDANINNPNQEKAEEKFKEIQQAYQQIMDEKEHGYQSQDEFGGYGGFGGFGFGGNTRSNAGSDENTIHMQAAANYIKSGHYREAINVLNGIKQRSAYWYYLSAVANAGIGNNVSALEHAKQASTMEPSNINYRQLAASLSGQGGWYESQRRPYSTVSTDGGGYCFKLCLLNMVCNLCCGGGGLCCGSRPYGGYM